VGAQSTHQPNNTMSTAGGSQKGTTGMKRLRKGAKQRRRKGGNTLPKKKKWVVRGETKTTHRERKGGSGAYLKRSGEKNEGSAPSNSDNVAAEHAKTVSNMGEKGSGCRGRLTRKTIASCKTTLEQAQMKGGRRMGAGGFEQPGKAEKNRKSGGRAKREERGP